MDEPTFMHGEPDAGKLARPVRGEGWRNYSPKGEVALHLYSTSHSEATSERRISAPSPERFR
jgi:hypothetical protein